MDMFYSIYLEIMTLEQKQRQSNGNRNSGLWAS